MKNRKKLVLSVSLLVACLFLFAGFNVAQEGTYALRFNTVAGPTMPQTKAMEKFGEVVEDLSGGKIQVKVFHSGQMGDQKTAFLGARRGSLEMTSDASPSFFADLCDYPEVGVFEAAYLFRSLDHAYRVLTGSLGQKYWDHIAETCGVKVLDFWFLGTRELNLTKDAGVVKTPEDLKGVKLRMPNVENWLDMGRALGAKPTPLGFGEVYMALKTGTVDGQDNPLPTDEAQKFYEVTHYIVKTDHMINLIYPVINKDLWDSMPSEYKAWINQAMRVARTYMNYLVLEGEATLLSKFKTEYGMEIIYPDKEAFMEHAKEFYSQDKFDQKWGEGMYEEIQSSP